MAELEDEQQAALKRAQAPKRPAGLSGESVRPEDSPQDEEAFERPERVEHTSEKEHPPGKE